MGSVPLITNFFQARILINLFYSAYVQHLTLQQLGIIKKLVTCYFNCSRCPSGIPHSAAVCISDIVYIVVSGKHSLIISCGSIGHDLGLLVG